MKLEVGMYVRTFKGKIGKVEYICDCEECQKRNYLEPVIFYGNDRTWLTSQHETNETIKKSSFNLIDLIEVGDYVNGHKVYKGDNGVLFLKIPNLDSLEIRTVNLKSADTNRQIINDTKWAKEILTHELFEANCYKVVE